MKNKTKQKTNKKESLIKKTENFSTEIEDVKRNHMGTLEL